MNGFIGLGLVDAALEPAPVLQLRALLAKLGLHEDFALRSEQLRLAEVRRVHGNRPVDELFVIECLSFEQERILLSL